MNPSQYVSPTRQNLANPDSSQNPELLTGDMKVDIAPSTVSLVHRLCQALEVEKINYCHWKSNDALDRSASGENDLDLLVSRDDIRQFTEILYRLGFKQAEAPAIKRIPGIVDYFGYDETADKLIHVHAHYQLVLGHDMTKNYRLPIEKPYLNSAVQAGLFKIPEVEFEFIVFVIRMMLKHAAWDVVLGGEGKLKSAERRELNYLQDRIDRGRVNEILVQHLPNIDEQLFSDCVQALQTGCPLWKRALTGLRLERQLRANARRPWPVDITLKLWRRAYLILHRRIYRHSPKYRLLSGGAMIAIVGGDGAGKSTAIDGLSDWLSKHFQTTQVHMGKPDWSWTTRVVRSLLKVGSVLGLYPGAASLEDTVSKSSLLSPGYPWLLREVCKGRDRSKLHFKARRLAEKGGLVINDRYPVDQIQIMDGPQTVRFINKFMDGPHASRFLSPHRSNRITRFLVKVEEGYYHQISPPDLLIVLLLDPEIAVQRKTTEDASHVRTRSTVIWNTNWQDSEAHIVDASQSKAQVLNALKALVWSSL
jgi:thymidylate kinase